MRKPNSKKWRDSVSKKIEQYDKEGNFIREWDSIKDAETSLKIKNINPKEIRNENKVIKNCSKSNLKNIQYFRKRFTDAL